MKDLIIGMASGYNVQTLKPFLISLCKSGYEGKLILLDPPVMEHHPIVERFRIMPKEITDDYRYVLAIDTKDVVFQSDPMEWIDIHIGGKDIIVQSEEVLYKHSEGNKKNMMDAFGLDWSTSELPVINGGVIAGRPGPIRSLLRSIFDICLMDKRENATYDTMLPDQSALNQIVYSPSREDILIANSSDGFSYINSHAPIATFSNGVIYPKGSSTPYAIFHQYVWNNYWRPIVKSLY